MFRKISAYSKQIAHVGVLMVHVTILAHLIYLIAHVNDFLALLCQIVHMIM